MQKYVIYYSHSKERETPERKEIKKMKKVTIKEILIGAVAEKLGCSEHCLRNYTKAQLKAILESEN